MCRSFLLVSAAVLAASLAGCSESPNSAAPNTAEVTLVSGDEKDLEALVVKHKGKVVFVDYWATYCKPCVKSFPHTVELHKQHQGEGLAVISVNFDLLDDEPRVKEFLKKQGATFNNLLSKYDGGGSDANDAFGIGPLPHLRLYDRQGKLRHKWDGKATDLDAKIKELLAEK